MVVKVEALVMAVGHRMMALVIVVVNAQIVQLCQELVILMLANQPYYK